MTSRRLEVVIHSANDLYNVKHFGTMSPYAKIWIEGGCIVSEQFKTKVAKLAGSSPVWHYPMKFPVASLENSCILFCEIRHSGRLFDRKIGEVQVPFTDLLAGKRKNASYPVKMSSGELKGEIILSHKMVGKLRPKKKLRFIKKIAKKVGKETVAIAVTAGLGLLLC